MAKQPTDAVQFTYESAERIANVVRAAELTPPATRPLSFEPFTDVRKVKQIRAATFSGSWSIGSSKVVTFKNAPTATASVHNLSWPITLTAYSNEDCIVGKDGTAWYLLVPKFEARTAVFVTQTQQRTFCSSTASSVVLTDIAINAALNTNSCTITIGKTNVTAEITVVGSTATAPVIVSSYTSTFLRLRVP